MHISCTWVLFDTVNKINMPDVKRAEIHQHGMSVVANHVIYNHTLVLLFGVEAIPVWKLV